MGTDRASSTNQDDPRAPTPRASLSSPGGSTPRTTGQLGEDQAAAHLRRLGFQIVARNVRTARGEIDLIAFDGATLVFVEVKCSRRGASSPGRADPLVEPLQRLGKRQRARLRGLALAWLSDPAVKRPRAASLRFDAIGVLLGCRGELLRLDHLEGAW
jgi:putative endonuclease